MELDSLQECGERFTTASTVGKDDDPCQAENCAQQAVCSLELRSLCLEHFISCSYRRLEQWSALACSDPPGTTCESNDRFLQECFLRSEHLLDTVRNADNLSRARLFDIFLWASEVSAKRSVSRTAGTPELTVSGAQFDRPCHSAAVAGPPVRETIRLR